MFVVETVTKFATSRASPKESKPGPRFAVVPGTETVTEEADFVFVVTVLMSTQSIPPYVVTINNWVEGLSRALHGLWKMASPFSICH